MDAGFIIWEMKNSILRICIVFLLVMWLAGLHAQQAVLSASNDATGSAGTASYSVGQIAYNYNTSTDGFVTEGVQQPFEILYGEGIEDPNGITHEYKLYPNPANAFVILKIESPEIKNLSCQLYNMNGFLLKTMKIESREVTLRMDDLASATYSLTVTGNDKVLQTFIIVKK